jgi:hypothetical protein
MMDRMAPDQPSAADAATPPEAVVEFGPETRTFAPARRWQLSRFAAGLAADRRAVPLAAAVGAVALFASLVSEWQVTSVDTTPFGGSDAGNRQVSASLADLGALGAGYLAGLFVLAGATVLVLFGPAGTRLHARLAGLTTGGMLLAVLAALGSDLGDVSRSIERIYLLELDEEDLVLAYGRGIWCAAFGAAAVLLALYLAGRHTPPAPEDADDDADDGEPAPVWSWRRPRGAEEESPPDEPFELTVEPATPFTSLNDDRDKPTPR